MKVLFKKIWRILGEDQRKGSFIFLLLIFFTTFFELLSISAVIPVVGVFFTQDNQSLNFFNYDLSYLFDYYSRYTLIAISASFFVIVFLIKSLILTIVSKLESKFIFEIQNDISKRIFGNILKEDLIFVNKKNSSEFLSILKEEVSLFGNALIFYIQLFFDLFLIFSILVFLIFLYPSITFIILLVLTIFGIIFYNLVNKKIIQLGIDNTIAQSETNKKILEAISLIKEIKIYNKFDFFKKRYDIFNDKRHEIAEKIYFFQKLPKYWFEFAAIFVFSLIFFIIATSDRNMVEVTVLLSVYAVSSIKLAPSVNKVIVSIQGIKFSNSSINLLDNLLFLRTNTILDKKLKDKKHIKKIDSFLEIRNLTFRYDKRLILDNLNLKISKGSIIGIKGLTGSGKSTLCNILLGLIDSYDGSIEVDGENIKDNLEHWQDLISYVPQSIYLTDETIEQNILFGEKFDSNKSENYKNIVKALKLDDIKHHKIYSSDKNKEITLGDRGASISGGQAQRIALARALYKNREFIILDEFTNGLDKDTEKKILDFITMFKNNKTIIIISHKDSTLNICNEVYLLDNAQLKKTSSV